MPTDLSSTEYQPSATPAGEDSDRSLPAGAGLALGVVAGTVIWVGAIALFLLL